MAETDEGPVEFGKIYADGARAWIKFAGKEDGSGTVLSELGELYDAFFYLQCRWIGKEIKVRRMVSKDKKADKENAYQNAEHNGKGFGHAGQREPVKEQKRSQSAHNKDANIQNKAVFAKDGSISMEKNRNKQGSSQYSQAQGGDDAGAIFFQTEHREESI